MKTLIWSMLNYDFSIPFILFLMFLLQIIPPWPYIVINFTKKVWINNWTTIGNFFFKMLCVSSIRIYQYFLYQYTWFVKDSTRSDQYSRNIEPFQIWNYICIQYSRMHQISKRNDVMWLYLTFVFTNYVCLIYDPSFLPWSAPRPHLCNLNGFDVFGKFKVIKS